MKKRWALAVRTVVIVALLGPATVANAQVMFSVLRSFNGFNEHYATGSLIQANDGFLYGMFYDEVDFGKVFRMDTDGGVFTTLHEFLGTEGKWPHGDLIQAADGFFYGMASRGGASDRGTIFKMDANGTFITLHEFSGTDGSIPMGNLIQAEDGYFYGMASRGGVNDQGTIFKMDVNGTFVTLHEFSGTDGAGPTGSLIQATDGILYGTTPIGGANWLGTVFKMDVSGTFTVLCSIPGWPDNGAGTPNGLMQASDGLFYGMTRYGGINSAGSIFRLNPNGTLTTLYSFQAGGVIPHDPVGNLIQANDGVFYGMTCLGGVNSKGAVFKFDGTETLTTLYSFTEMEGYLPLGSLIQASDGLFYGMTSRGGALATGDHLGEGGTVFRLADASVFHAEISALQGHVSQLQNDVDGLTEQVSTLTSTNTELQAQLSELGSSLESVVNDFRIVFKNPTFFIPGNSIIGRYQNLVLSILSMTKGEKNPIYRFFLGK